MPGPPEAPVRRPGRARFTALLLGLVALAAGLAAGQTLRQTLPPGREFQDGNGATGFVTGSTPSEKWQWVYDASLFTHPGPIVITGLALRASAPNETVQAFSFPSVVVTLSSSPNSYSLGPVGTQAGQSTVFAQNLGPDATVVRTGPWTGGPVASLSGPVAPWVPIDLLGPWTYDPTLGLDLLVQIERCGVTAPWGVSHDGAVTPNGASPSGMMYGNNLSCTATTRNWSLGLFEWVPILQVTYLPQSSPLAPYQTNQAGAGLEINGLTTGGLVPAIATLPTSFPGIITFASILAGAPFDVAAGIGPLQARGAGGTTLADGQVFNLDTADVSLGLFFGGFLSPPFAPSQFSFTTTSPANAAAQMAVIDPSTASGVRLSQAVRLIVP